MQNRESISFVLILLLTSLAVWIILAPGDRFLGRDVHTRLGLDLQGGIQVLLRAAREDVSRDEMQVAAGVIERRVNALGVGETVVQLSGEDRIIVELPGVDDPQQAIETLKGTGSLEFIDPMGQPLIEGQVVRTQNNPNPIQLQVQEQQSITGTETLTPTAPLTPDVSDTIFASITDGSDLDTDSVQPTFTEESGLGNRPAVSFAFREDSATRLAQFSAQNVGNPMCIVLDNTVVSCPVIQQALSQGEGVITTNNIDDRDRIYRQLKFGALPVPLQVETSRTVSATLGEESVQDSMLAGAVGLTVVALFMILYYRLPGVLAVIALLIYTALSLALYRLTPHHAHSGRHCRICALDWPGCWMQTCSS
ncbi:MAG: protein translocase subunit SecD, partial [Chloroflexaceae bacterium]|nr:protein translocase subunit SecD [Chloroflexaceae bacterium]